MKKLLFILSLSFSSLLFSQASMGGPDNFGYTFKSSLNATGPSYSWFDISTIGSLVTGLGDDNFVGPYQISGFSYYSSAPTQLYIGSNGYISFQPVNIASTNAQFPAIPGTSAPNYFIAPMLTDLTFGGLSSNPATAYYYDQGDTICITYDKVPFWVNNTNQYAGDNSFQIILNKADSSITFNYKQQVGMPDPTYTTNFVSIGIESQAGNDGLQYFRGDSFPNPLTTVKFTYPTIIQNITDVEISFNNNDKNGAEFITQNSNYTPSVSIKNIGNQDISNSISVTTRISTLNGVSVYTNTQNIDSLASGIDSMLNFNSYTPTTIGEYVVTSYLNRVMNDGVISNDTNQVFFKVLDANTSTQELDYTNGISGPGIGWTGGNGGCAIYVEPPYFPAYVQATNFYITTTGTPAVGFHSIVYDDNGRGPGQGTILDSTYIAPTAIAAGQYHSVTPTNGITITNGGVYLLWLMDGDGINLGRSFKNPASNRTFEVINSAWSDYRDKTTEDFLMNLEISPMPVGINESYSKSKLKLFPNPTSNQITLEVEQHSQSAIIEVLDINGKVMNVKTLRFDGKVIFYTNTLLNGTYFMRYNKIVEPFVVKH